MNTSYLLLLLFRHVTSEERVRKFFGFEDTLSSDNEKKRIIISYDVLSITAIVEVGQLNALMYEPF